MSENRGYEDALEDDSSIVDLWKSHLDSKEGSTYNLHRVEKGTGDTKFKSISELKLGKNYIRGIVPNDFLPIVGRAFRMYHYTVDGVYNFGIVMIEACVDVFKENNQYVFGDGKSSERFVLIPCETVSN